MDKDKKTKCDFKCLTCQHYSKQTDFCKEKDIVDCSKKVYTEFSNCKDYIINEKLVMF